MLPEPQYDFFIAGSISARARPAVEFLREAGYRASWLDDSCGPPSGRYAPNSGMSKTRARTKMALSPVNTTKLSHPNQRANVDG